MFINHVVVSEKAIVKRCGGKEKYDFFFSLKQWKLVKILFNTKFCPMKKLLKNLGISWENTFEKDIFFRSYRPLVATFLEKMSSSLLFSCEFCEILHNMFSV